MYSHHDMIQSLILTQQTCHDTGDQQNRSVELIVFTCTTDAGEIYRQTYQQISHLRAQLHNSWIELKDSNPSKLTGESINTQPCVTGIPEVWWVVKQKWKPCRMLQENFTLNPGQLINENNCTCYHMIKINCYQDKWYCIKIPISDL